ncbi:MAG: hypothetical protein ACREO3_02935 [Arenimonas sp.]
MGGPRGPRPAPWPDAKTGKRRNPGTFATREAAEKHDRETQYFKRR